MISWIIMKVPKNYPFLVFWCVIKAFKWIFCLVRINVIKSLKLKLKGTFKCFYHTPEHKKGVIFWNFHKNLRYHYGMQKCLIFPKKAPVWKYTKFFRFYRWRKIFYLFGRLIVQTNCSCERNTVAKYWFRSPRNSPPTLTKTSGH